MGCVQNSSKNNQQEANFLSQGRQQNQVNNNSQSVNQLHQETMQILQQIQKENPQDPLSVLLEKLRSKYENSSYHACEGIMIQTNPNVKVVAGPVIGKIDSTTANILIEVIGPVQKVELICYVIQRDGSAIQRVTKTFESRQAENFFIQNLKPNTYYKLVFGGVNINDARNSVVEFKTYQQQIERFKIIALSCNRQDRVLFGQQNPWQVLLEQQFQNQQQPVDLMLHLGDQVYAVGSEIEDLKELFDKYEKQSPQQQIITNIRGKELFRKVYRDTWDKPFVRDILKKTSNLMIWSDNDVANDFTTLKGKDGNQAYPKQFLKCGIEVYREYQRQLWDKDCLNYNEKNVEEWHCHKYGPIGVFMIDMRGNRIAVDGTQQDHNPIMSEKQWNDLINFVNSDDLKVLVVCSEIPFVGDSPETAKKNSAKFDFLRDHWPYQVEELTKLLDLLFTFKAKTPGREVIMVGGDIHTGVSSVIYDSQNKSEIRHFTTSPISNHVCKYYCELSGNINSRYSYKHVPLGEHLRNYLVLDIQIQPTVKVESQLVSIEEEGKSLEQYHYLHRQKDQI